MSSPTARSSTRSAAHRLVPVVVVDDADAGRPPGRRARRRRPAGRRGHAPHRAAASTPSARWRRPARRRWSARAPCSPPQQVDDAVAAGAPLRRVARAVRPPSCGARRSTACPCCRAPPRHRRSWRRSTWGSTPSSSSPRPSSAARRRSRRSPRRSRALRFVPTGGIGAANLADYLRCSPSLAVGGSWMVDREPRHRGRLGRDHPPHRADGRRRDARRREPRPRSQGGTTDDLAERPPRGRERATTSSPSAR